MKKIAIFTLAIAALSLFASCSKEEAPVKKTTKVTVDIKVADLAPGTRALKQNWEEGDKINIWFNGVSSPHYNYWRETPHLVLTRTGGSWISSEVDESLLSASGTFNVVYEASNSFFNSAINNDRVFYPEGTSFKLTAMDGPCNPKKMITTCYYNNISYTYDSGTKKISGAISQWNFLTMLQVVVTGLEADPDRYAMTFAGGVETATQLFYTSGITPSNIGTCNGPANRYNWMNGISNTDGVAFNFYTTLNNGTYAYTVYLVDKTAKKTYSFSISTSTPTSLYGCKGVKIAKTSFTDVTSTYPVE